MSCKSTRTFDEIRDSIANKRIINMKNDTVEEIVETLDNIRNMVVTVDVVASKLSTKVRKQLFLSDDEMISRYVFAGTEDVAAERRITDENSRKFKEIKGKKEADRISNLPDNVIKADGGTKVHAVLQNLMERIIETSGSKHIEKNSSRKNYKQENLSDKELIESSGLSESSFKNAIAGIKEIFSQIEKVQKELDPKGKATIFTEQPIYNPVTDTMGTTDIYVVFSDGTHGTLDYKTMSPSKDKKTWDSNKRQYSINEDNWIPFYNIDKFNSQLNTINDTAIKFMGSKGTRISRIVPIHIEYKMKPKGLGKSGEFLTDKVAQLSMGSEQNKFLSQIPIGELTSSEKLNKTLKILMVMRDNSKKRLDNIKNKTSPEAVKLISEIERRSNAINKLILNKDISVLLGDFANIVSKFYKGIGEVKNIDNEFINGVKNPDYMSIEEIDKFIQEIQAYKNIVDSSGEYIAELKIRDEKTARDYIERAEAIAYRAGVVLNQIKEIRLNRVLSKSEQSAAQDSKPTNIWDRLFRGVGNQSNIIFRKFSSLLDNAYNKKRLKEQELHQEIIAKIKSIEEWGRRNGLSNYKIYDKLIGKDGNLHSKYTGELYQKIKDAQESNDLNFLKRHLKLKDDADKIRQNNLESYISNKNPNEDEIRDWNKKHSAEEAILSRFWWLYYEVNEDVSKDFYSDGYKFISKAENKELMEFWDFWTSKMKEFRSILGFEKDYEKIPNNFLPWIRTDIVEMMQQGGMNIPNVKETISSLFQIKEDDTLFGEEEISSEIDPVTGRELRSIPKFFINPLKDNHGRINSELKSRDLGKSLLIFGSMAYNYHFMKSEVEPQIEGLRDALVTFGHLDISESGNIKKSSGFKNRILGDSNAELSMFDSFVKYHLHGVKIQDEGIKKTHMKFAMQMKAYQQIKELGGSILAGLGNAIQIKTNSYLEGMKGYYYTNKQMNNSHKMMTGINGKDAQQKAKGLIYYFDPNPGHISVKTKNLSISTINKWVNTDTAFLMFRKPEENINETVLLSVLQNYGFDKNGNIRRIKNLPSGSKPIIDLVSFKGDKMVIDGVIDENGATDIVAYNQIRNMAVNVSKFVKGSMSSEDINLVNTSLLGNLMMGFKNWLPGMAGERFSSIRYNPKTKSVVEGRYVALVTDLARDNKGFGEWMGNIVLPKMLKFSLDVATFGPILNFKPDFLKYKINEERARILFDKFKEENPNDEEIQTMTLEDFLDYKQGQIKALAGEVSIILLLVSMVLMLGGDWDDDGVPDYKSSWAGRTLFRITNRARREMAFFISPQDQMDIIRTPLPVSGLLMDTVKLWKNFLDETGDIVHGEYEKRSGLPGFVFGKNRGKDKKQNFYETIRWIPGHKLIQMLDLFEAYEDRTI